MNTNIVLLRKFLTMNSLIIILIGLNVFISIKGFNDRAFFDRFKFNIEAIQQGQWFRMFSSGFLHVDWMHLFFNMYALYLFGEVVLLSFGIFGFVFIYTVSLFSGSLISYFVHKKDSYYSAVGASGAVSGVLYAAVLVYPDMRLILFPIPIPLPAYVFAVAYLFYSIYGMKKSIGNIGHSAHLGGAIGGLFCAVILNPNLVIQSPILSLVLFGSLIFLYFFRNKFRK